MDEKVAKMMRLLDISEEEAVAMLEEDKRIDRGEKLYELPPELAGSAKKLSMKWCGFPLTCQYIIKDDAEQSPSPVV